ncbi:hypothetical protein CDAR_572111 [Caerostris darwini]|uniref:Uncharacterized protein n=1 Tax=Caerostris darwini TaxID=1538125 RepID=A0AAV4R7I6_9ARAC|nr:hypothetical protein CDAR_572111 [Caerostris darwini]
MENPPGIHGWIHVKSPPNDSSVVLWQVKHIPAATDPEADAVILTVAAEAVTCTASDEGEEKKHRAWRLRYKIDNRRLAATTGVIDAYSRLCARMCTLFPNRCFPTEIREKKEKKHRAWRLRYKIDNRRLAAATSVIDAYSRLCAKNVHAISQSLFSD